MSSPAGRRVLLLPITLSLSQQALRETLTAGTPTERLQRIFRHRNNPDGLAIVQPNQLCTRVYVMAPAYGSRNHGLSSFCDCSLHHHASANHISQVIHTIHNSLYPNALT
jgi:hypothetical protein